jgi:hypothetical protein
MTSVFDWPKALEQRTTAMIGKRQRIRDTSIHGIENMQRIRSPAAGGTIAQILAFNFKDVSL